MLFTIIKEGSGRCTKLVLGKTSYAMGYESPGEALHNKVRHNVKLIINIKMSTLTAASEGNCNIVLFCQPP